MKRLRNRRLAAELAEVQAVVMFTGARTKIKCILSVVIMVATVCGSVTRSMAEDERESPYRWKPKVTSVTVFKNGLGFFLREGKVALRDGWCVSEAVPPASFGTLAVYSHAKNETVDTIATGPGEIVEFDGVDAPQDTVTKRGRLLPFSRRGYT